MRTAWLASLLGLAFAPAALTPAAPVPRDAGPRYFYPTRVGDRMVRTLMPGSRDIITTVAKVEKADAAWRVTVNSVAPDGKESLDETMEVSSKGVRMLTDACPSSPLMHPVWEIKSTPDADAEWSNRWPVVHNRENVFADHKFAAKGWETVEVPAGKFMAVRIERSQILMGEKSQRTFWYALGVGCVKCKYDTGYYVLKSFTPGPK